MFFIILFENGTGEAYFEKTGSTKIFFPAIKAP